MGWAEERAGARVHPRSGPGEPPSLSALAVRVIDRCRRLTPPPAALLFGALLPPPAAELAHYLLLRARGSRLRPAQAHRLLVENLLPLHRGVAAGAPRGGGRAVAGGSDCFSLPQCEYVVRFAHDSHSRGGRAVGGLEILARRSAGLARIVRVVLELDPARVTSVCPLRLEDDLARLDLAPEDRAWTHRSLNDVVRSLFPGARPGTSRTPGPAGQGPPAAARDESPGEETLAAPLPAGPAPTPGSGAGGPEAPRVAAQRAGGPRCSCGVPVAGCPRRREHHVAALRRIQELRVEEAGLLGILAATATACPVPLPPPPGVPLTPPPEIPATQIPEQLSGTSPALAPGSPATPPRCAAAGGVRGVFPGTPPTRAHRPYAPLPVLKRARDSSSPSESPPRRNLRTDLGISRGVGGGADRAGGAMDMYSPLGVGGLVLVGLYDGGCPTGETTGGLAGVQCSQGCSDVAQAGGEEAPGSHPPKPPPDAAGVGKAGEGGEPRRVPGTGCS